MNRRTTALFCSVDMRIPPCEKDCPDKRSSARTAVNGPELQSPSVGTKSLRAWECDQRFGAVAQPFASRTLLGARAHLSYLRRNWGWGEESAMEMVRVL